MQVYHLTAHAAAILAEGFRDAVLVVPHGLVVHDVDADLGQPLGDPLRVRVGDLAEEDLGPDPDDLRPHGTGEGRVARMK